MSHSKIWWRLNIGKPPLQDVHILILADKWYIRNKIFRRELYKMVRNSTGKHCRIHAKDLTKWTKQGVMIWDMDQHRKMETISMLSCFKTKKKPGVILLWGPAAWAMNTFIGDQSNLLVLKAHRPSKFTYRPFFKDCDHFHLAEQWIGREIDWSL